MRFFTVKHRVYVHVHSLLNVNVFQPVCYLSWKLKKRWIEEHSYKKTKNKKKDEKESVTLHTVRS